MALSLFSSCRTTKNAASIADIEGEWNITSINNQPLSIEKGATQPFIGFDTEAGRIYGNSGCNRIMSSLDLKAKPGEITFKQMASTMMAGPGMETEKEVLAALSQAKTYRKSGKDEIVLYDGNKKAVVGLEKRCYPMTTDELQGEWTVVKVFGEPLPETAGEKPFIAFDFTEKKINGYSGCNRFMGKLNINEGEKVSISIPPVAATRMACPNMEVENNILSALSGVKTFGKLKNKRVALFTAGGAQVLELTQK